MSNTLFSWVLALVLAGAMIFLGGFMKLYAPEIQGATESPELFGKIDIVAAHYTGMSFMEPWGRWVIGVLEVLTGLLLLVPATRMMGAFLSLVITAGAIGSHVAGEFVPDSEFGLGVMTGGQADYMLFGTAVVLFVLSIGLLVVGGRD